jgi:hypothetical protein
MAISLLYSQSGTLHSRIEVVQKRNLRMMRFGKRGGWQGAFHTSRPDRPVFPYQRAFKTVVRSMNRVDQFLSIGVGTGTGLHSVYTEHQNAKLHGVEIDKTVLEVAMKYFQAPDDDRAKYWVGDGCAFLTTSEADTYDLIFIDAYMANSIYQPAMQTQVLEALVERLTRGGVAVYNLIAQNLHEGRNGQFINEAKKRFSTILDLPVGLPFSDQNHILILSQCSDFEKRLVDTLSNASFLPIIERFGWPWRLKKL